ncbi:phosphoribosyltransferase [Roseomonas sp. 18066]|uniref:phosphoribosyltransferase n=1 Tax=Roseomonas sp. 18066 TaxID=2681412 RepID=UPI001F300846|nr:phosphoribosyltransferase [Roseomonas sp. 18066]
MRVSLWCQGHAHGIRAAMSDAFWQDFADPDPVPAAGYHDRYPAPMPDGRRLVLPLRDYGAVAVTGFIANQASFAVVRAMTGWMAGAARRFGAEVVVGLPTLGHVFGGPVAEALGHTNWVAPGYSRKKWYDAALSVPTSSSTAPDARRMWLDPRLLPRLAGRRVLLVDDVISTGSSALAGLGLLRLAGVEPVGLCVALAQGDRWQPDWRPEVPVAAGFCTPLFLRGPDGWRPDFSTLPRGVSGPGFPGP